MGSDDRIAASLPQPPLPAPARRAAAIEAALRRFDGEGEPAPGAVAGAPRPAPWWRHMDYRQVGALASVALVAVIALPLAWTSMDEQAPLDHAAPPAATTDATNGGSSAEAYEVAEPQPPAMRLEPSTAGEAARSGEPPAPVVPGAAPPPVVFADAAPAPVIAPTSQAMSRTVAGTARFEVQAAEPVALAAREERGRTAPAASGPMAPPAAVAEIATADAAESSIVVTGARAASAKSARGDWNACTVDDPLRSLEACTQMVDPSAKGSTGRAAAQVADGLSLAWRGDIEGAIAAFDRAIQRSPGSSFAYLNRGLAHRRNGNLDRAIADLDRAVRSDPDSARAYYNRSLLLRQKGDLAAARADEARAAQLDPRYARLVGEGRRP